jgi:hypothetical protein
MFENDQVEGYLVGDGGYACRSYMMTPLLNPTTGPEKKYNVAQIQARNRIERTNGILKRRFPCLKYGLRLKLENTVQVIIATIVLHNIAIITQDVEPDDDEVLGNYIASRRQRGLQAAYDPVEAMPPVGLIPAGATGMRSSLIN